MKRKKIALLLAMTLTMTQGMGATVSAAAEELLSGEGSEQEIVLDGSDEAPEVLDEEETVEQGTPEGAVTAPGVEASADADVATDMDLPAAQNADSITVEGVEVLENDGDDGDGEAHAKSPYQLNYEYLDTIGNGAMLPNSTMTISTSLWSTDGDWEEISDYELGNLKLAEDCEKLADVSVEDHNLVIKSGSQTGSMGFTVEVLLDGKTIHTEEIWFEISEYEILPKTITDASGKEFVPQVGDRVDIVNDMKPQLVRYADGTGDPIPVTGDNYKIVISSWTDDETGETNYDYNSEGWKWISVDGQELPILERISGGNTQFGLTAMEKNEDGEWQQIARREYDLDTLPGYYEDGSEGDHNDDSEAKSQYELQYGFADTIGNGAMLPNSHMTMKTVLADKGADYAAVNDYKLEIVQQSQLGKASVTDGGKNLLIQSSDKLGSGRCYVSVQVPDGNGGYQEAFKKDIWFEVSDLMLTPQKLMDKSGNLLNPAVGASVNLADLGVKLVRYENGQGDPIDMSGDNIKIVVASWYDEEMGETQYDYDPHAWKLQEVEGQDLPVLTRTSGDSTWFALTALKNDGDGQWYQIARLQYDIDATEESHNHTWDAGVITKEATCAEAGTRTYTCTVCKETKSETIPASGNHTWDAGVVTKEATCTEAGIRTYTCTVCKETKTEEIPATGHKAVTDAAVAATVLTEGKTEGSHCSVCGTVLKPQGTVARLTPTISLTDSSLKMKTGQSTTAFRASGFAVGDSVTKVTSSNEKVVKVSAVKSDGTFKLTAGKKAGTATVTVYLASTGEKSFKVTVQKAAVKTTRLTTTAKELTMVKGSTYKQLASTVTVAPVTSKEKVSYSSSNKKVATVNAKGVITAKKAGTAKITIKSGKKKAVVTVKVTGVKTTGLTGVPVTKTVSKGKTFKMKVKAAPKNTDEKITYTSSNKKIATVTSKGVVKGIRKGTATITVRSGSIVKTCEVTVK